MKNKALHDIRIALNMRNNLLFYELTKDLSNQQIYELRDFLENQIADIENKDAQSFDDTDDTEEPALVSATPTNEEIETFNMDLELIIYRVSDKRFNFRKYAKWVFTQNLSWLKSFLNEFGVEDVDYQINKVQKYFEEFPERLLDHSLMGILNYVFKQIDFEDSNLRPEHVYYYTTRSLINFVTDTFDEAKFWFDNDEIKFRQRLREAMVAYIRCDLEADEDFVDSALFLFERSPAFEQTCKDDVSPTVIYMANLYREYNSNIELDRAAKDVLADQLRAKLE